jgi:hypothetical protein
VSRYGPIKKTTSPGTRNGTRLPPVSNPGEFRDEPDAMPVTALERYDEAEDLG